MNAPAKIDPRKTQRAYSTVEIKAVGGTSETWTIRGIASTPTTDRGGDTVSPEGATFNLPIPLLWQHDASHPIGHVTEATVTAKGIEIVASGMKGVTAEIDGCWAKIAAGLVRGLSIGFRGIEADPIPNSWGIAYKVWEWLELSAVTIPKNAEATIAVVKACDTGGKVASDRNAPRSNPGASAYKSNSNREGTIPMAKKTIAEQISAFEATRQVKAARLSEIMEAAADTGETLDQGAQDEFDDVEREMKAIGDHLKRLKSMEDAQMHSAKAVEVDSREAGIAVRGGAPARAIKHLPKGTGFTRMAMALMASKGVRSDAMDYAQRWKDSTPEVVDAIKASFSGNVIKAAVTAGTVTDADWAKPLVEYQNMASEFIELLRPQTIIGQIAGLRQVPFNVKIPVQTGGSTVGWVGEAKPKPVGEMAFSQITMGMTKAAGIIVLSEELVMSSTPSAEALVRADMTAQMAQFLDAQFVDPSVAAVADVSPASITNGATYITASGIDADAVKADVQQLFRQFIAANLSVAGAVWIMDPTTALTLSMMQNALGQSEFGGITMNGGTFYGLPVITSTNIAASTVDAAAIPATVVGKHIILARASDILVADDGDVRLDVSREASIQLNSTPTVGPAQLVSLWQNNLVGLRAERFINWRRRRNEAVTYISGANYAA